MKNPALWPRPLRRLFLLALLWTTGLSLGACACACAYAADWTTALEREAERLDRAAPGELGVYVKRLSDGREMAYRADERWYLASSAKLPIALVLLQEVEAGRLQLEQAQVLQDGDKVDGPGPTVWQRSGSRITIDELLQRMLMRSDNTAANMLMRALGEDRVNRRVRGWLGRGFVGLTDFAQVRYDVYAELHPRARELTNAELLQIGTAPIGPRRLRALRRALNVESDELRADSFDQAYSRYYARGLNAATLQGYGSMLEDVVRGRLVKKPELLWLLYRNLKYDGYDAYRLEAGLPRSERFIHKTGTQHRCACHMGVINPQDGGRNAVIVATCAHGLDEHAEVPQLFERVGRAITRIVLQQKTGS